MRHAFKAFIIITVVFTSCFWKRDVAHPENRKVLGYVPVYSNDPALKLARNDSPRNVVNAGKIYVYQNYLFQCEVGEGIHIIDNTVPANATRIGFIRLAGANEIAIKGNRLYSNSYSDVVVININNIRAVTEVSRIPDAFHVAGYLPVPPNEGYYECVDLRKGIVVDWKRDSVSTTCYNSK